MPNEPIIFIDETAEPFLHYVPLPRFYEGITFISTPPSPCPFSEFSRMRRDIQDAMGLPATQAPTPVNPPLTADIFQESCEHISRMLLEIFEETRRNLKAPDCVDGAVTQANIDRVFGLNQDDATARKQSLVRHANHLRKTLCGKKRQTEIEDFIESLNLEN